MIKFETEQGRKAAIAFCDEPDWLSRAKPTNPYEGKDEIDKYISQEDGFEEYFKTALDWLDCQALESPELA